MAIFRQSRIDLRPLSSLFRAPAGQILTLSPAVTAYEESSATLRFGRALKTGKTTATAKPPTKAALVEMLEKEVAARGQS